MTDTDDKMTESIMTDTDDKMTPQQQTTFEKIVTKDEIAFTSNFFFCLNVFYLV